jgi:hypothetical protein
VNGRPLEVADIVRAHGGTFLDSCGSHLSAAQRRALFDVGRCRTAALGGHKEQCNACGFQRIAYNSCRNRHCPKCQGPARAAWLAERAADLLPVPYFHVVFTLPHQLAPVALQNPRTVYGLLFDAAAKSLLEVAANPKHLGARLGLLAVLHTWGQNLMHHPHVHCVVPGGGFALDDDRWVSSRSDFLLPVRVLSRVFRGKFLHGLQAAHAEGRLGFFGSLVSLADRSQWNALLDESVRQDWVVYAKPPFGGPQQVLKYLARYTHRVAVANRRLLAMDGDQVTFRWKDYSDNNAQKTMTLHPHEFLRRFLLHILPRGFVKLRHFGFLANRCRKERLAQARVLLSRPATPERNGAAATVPALPPPASNVSCADNRCRQCGVGEMLIVELLPSDRCFRREVFRSAPNTLPIASVGCDTS